MIYAQYDTTTGFIAATVSLPVAELPEGRAQIEVPDGVSGGTHKINLDTLEVEPLPIVEEPAAEE